MGVVYEDLRRAPWRNARTNDRGTRTSSEMAVSMRKRTPPQFRDSGATPSESAGVVKNRRKLL